MDFLFSLFKRASGTVAGSEYKQDTSSYLETFSRNSTPTKRAEKAPQMVKSYYNLVTDLYEFGWGQSFHFAPRFKGEPLKESLRRHEYFMSARIGIKEGDLVLDAGCGVMGPARNIARFSGARVVGINLNSYQIERCQSLNAQVPFSSRLSCVEGNFTRTEFESGKFDHIYSIEAFCHGMDPGAIFREMMRLLKPGGTLGCYEWVLTDKFDPSDAEHRGLKEVIEKGSGIGALRRACDIEKRLKESGFEIMEFMDLADANTAQSFGNDEPWYKCFEPGFTISDLQRTALGMWLVNKVLRVLESVRIAPQGVAEMQKLLWEDSRALLKSGVMGIFSPMFFVLARKPMPAC